MAAAIPAAIGVGSSIIGGIQGKGAAKRQEKFAREQWNTLLPMMQAQNAAAQEAFRFGRGVLPQAQNAIQTVFNQATGTYEPLMQDYRSMLRAGAEGQQRFNEQGDRLIGRGEGMMDTGQNLLKSSLPHLLGASSALSDLQQFYRPFMYDGQRAIDRFIPGKAQLDRFLAGTYSDVNQGYKSASENIANFAPRGGGRVSTMAQADVNRQQQLTQARSQGSQALFQTNLQNAFQGAQGEQNRANALAQLGLGQGQLGLSQGQLGLGTIGAGQQSKQLGISEFGSKAQAGLGQLSQALQALGLGGQQAGALGQLGTGVLGAGLSGGQQAANLFGNLYNAQANRAYGATPPQSDSEGLGSFLYKTFSTPGAQDWLKGIFPGGKGKKTGGTGVPGPMPGGKVPSEMPGGKTPS